MKILGLLRHAKSDWDDIALRDFDRGLNERGKRGASLMGRHVIDHGIKWDMILASPANRVQRTLEASGIKAPIQYEQTAYLADALVLTSLLRDLDTDPARVLLAAHNPGLQELILDLADATDRGPLYDEVTEKYPTASFAVLELDIDKWSECHSGCGRLVHFARPRDLDPELGPERVD